MIGRVLLADDDRGLLSTLSDRLEAEGFAVETAEDGRSALERSSQGALDLIVLDLTLPALDGLDVCLKLREDGVSTPILMLTARKRLEDKLRGFELGADDYLTKPFETSELLARIKALLRWRTPRIEGQSMYRFGSNYLDRRTKQLHRHGESVPLTVKEYQLLEFLLKHPRDVLSRSRLLKEIWNYEDRHHGTRTVDMHVGFLRRKIEADPKNPRFLRTAFGMGYRFVPD